jgi:DNA-directed RNA polymerase alpha subunit
MNVEPVQSTPSNKAKISGRDVSPTPFTQQILPLAPEPSQELHASFFSSLGLGVRATNVLVWLNLKTVTQFIALDKQTLLRTRNCGKKTASEIMEAVTRYKLPIEAEATPGEIDALSLSAAMEHVPVTELRLSVRATCALKSLNISTVGQLARVTDR